MKLGEIAAGIDTRETNCSRHLQKFMVRSKHALRVPMTMVTTPLRARRFARRCKVVHEPWPVLHLRDWMRVSFEEPYLGGFFLGGYLLTELQKAEDLLQQFWDTSLQTARCLRTRGEQSPSTCMGTKVVDWASAP